MHNSNTQILAGPPIIPFVAILFIFCLIIILSITYFLRLWLQAYFAGTPISFAQLIGMKLRKVDARQIVICRITAVHAGLDITIQQMEVHYLTGGDVTKVVRALILAKRENIELSWEDATKIDLAGRDILAETQAAVETKVES
ncbi:MAG: flotillin-like FloA family protein [Planctomycetota bacterium]|jgi:uncharacterized protein YqfA (UPF0365 family)